MMYLIFILLSLSWDGPCLTLYQELMSGGIDWSANFCQRRERHRNPGSFPAIRSMVFLLLKRDLDAHKVPRLHR